MDYLIRNWLVFSSHWNPHVARTPKCYFFDISPFKLLFHPNYRLDLFHHGRNRKVSTFWEVLGLKSEQSRSYTAFVALLRRQKFLWSGLISIFKFVSLQTTDLNSLFKVSICLKYNFLLLLKYTIKNSKISSVQWNPDGPELPASVVTLDRPRFKNSHFFRSICFIFPSKFKSIASFEADYLFPNIAEVIVAIGIGVRTYEIWQKYY